MDSFGDPWLYLTAFGFVASAGLLVYLVRQLNAVSDGDEGELEAAAEGGVNVPMPPEDEPAPTLVKASAPPRGTSIAPPAPVEAKAAAASAVTDIMGGAPEPKPQPKAEPKLETAPARQGREFSAAVSFIKALHEDIQTFHWEIQGIKKKLDTFEDNQEKQMAFLMEKLQHLDKMMGDQSQGPKPPAGPSEPPPVPFQ